MREPVDLRLTRDEAIVIYEFLSRYTDTGKLTIEDQAEQRVLWDMCATLEALLHEQVSPQYEETLRQARSTVRDATD